MIKTPWKFYLLTFGNCISDIMRVFNIKSFSAKVYKLLQKIESEKCDLRKEIELAWKQEGRSGRGQVGETTEELKVTIK